MAENNSNNTAQEQENVPRRPLPTGGVLLFLLVLTGLIVWFFPGSDRDDESPAAPVDASEVQEQPRNEGADPGGAMQTSKPANAHLVLPEIRDEDVQFPGGMSAQKWNALTPNAQRRTRDLIRYAQEQLDQIGAADSEPLNDLKAVYDILQNYQLTIKANHGLPIGTHREIVRALRGNNPWGIPFLPADHPALTGDDQIVDRWGTPFFFHALAADEIEIRSAGSDRTMWSEDDLLYPPPVEEGE